jgi:aminopeptidase
VSAGLTRDQRPERLAELLVDTVLGVQPGWQVVVLSSPPARPAVEAVTRLIGRRGAYALTHISFSSAGDIGWLQEAPLELVGTLPSITAHELETMDAIIQIAAPENTRDASAIPSDRLQLFQKALEPALRRVIKGEVPWVGCMYPTPAVAQDAGMSLSEFEDFFFGAALLDWDAERERMQHYADRFDAAEEVRIVGEETDLRLSLAGRRAKVDAGGANIPGGEFFFSPVEDSAEGTIAFTEFPAMYAGREVKGIRLRFEQGVAVDVTAESEEAFLLEVLDTDEGARRVGELGIGCNPGITRYMKNVAFDEKIDGTVHIALGLGFPELGGSNESAVHWDIVKDLRPGGRIELDGEVVQENGKWTI